MEEELLKIMTKIQHENYIKYLERKYKSDDTSMLKRWSYYMKYQHEKRSGYGYNKKSNECNNSFR